MMHRASWIIALMLVSSGAGAAELSHTLRAGESLETVARHYYGSPWKAAYIAARNGLARAEEAKVGKAYVIPETWLYKVRRGDSAATLAKRYLGEVERFRALMEANGIKNAQDLEVGRELLIPFHLKHTVQQGQSLAEIARLYYRSTRQAKLLQEYNALPNANLEPGKKLVVPIFDRAALDLKARGPVPAPAPLAAASAPAEGPKPQTPPPVATEQAVTPTPSAQPSAAPAPASVAAKPANELDRLRGSVERYRVGDFDEACGEFERLVTADDLTRAERVVVIQHLGFCAVAQGDEAAAQDYFRKWLELAPGARLDPISTSPKILAVFEAVLEESSAGDRGERTALQ